MLDSGKSSSTNLRYLLHQSSGLTRINPRKLEIDYFALRDDFQVYLGRCNQKTAYCVLSYLDRFVGSRAIRSPLDVAGLFNGLSAGQLHQLDRALGALLNFCLLKGYPEDWVRLLKKAIPKEPEFIDLRVPEEHEVAESLKKMGGIPLKYRAVLAALFGERDKAY